MLSRLLRDHAARAPGDVLVLDGAGTHTYDEVWTRAAGLAAAWRGEAAETLYFHLPDSADLVAGLAAADLMGRTACVLSARWSVAEAHAVAGRLGGGAVVAAPARAGEWADMPVLGLDGGAAEPWDAGASDVGRIAVLTSGTTGEPKATLHRWERLLGQVRGGAPERWLSVYPLNHFAGVAVLAHVVATGSGVRFLEDDGYGSVADALTAGSVDAVSGTPTFWRMFLGLTQPVTGAFTGRITLGGEVATQDLLDGLSRRFPKASIAHVYATSEVGSCFSVADGREGFPADYLDRSVGNVELRVRDGELEVRAPLGMLGYAGTSATEPGSWHRTGDLVEQVGDRVCFRGRREEVINVAGVKVMPQKVEAVLVKVPGVQAASVFGAANPVTGQLVSAELVLLPGGSEDDVLAAVRDACARELSRHEMPRDVRVVEELVMVNRKVRRRRES